MIYSLIQKYNYLLAGTLIIAHLATCFLSPWFHRHPERNHVQVKGDFYHSHTLSFTSPVLEFDQDHYDLQVVLHHIESSQPFDEKQVFIEAHLVHTFIFSKYVPQIDFFGLLIASLSIPKFVVKTTIEFLPVRPTQDYFFLTATGLSPPIA